MRLLALIKLIATTLFCYKSCMVKIRLFFVKFDPIVGFFLKIINKCGDLFLIDTRASCAGSINLSCKTWKCGNKYSIVLGYITLRCNVVKIRPVSKNLIQQIFLKISTKVTIILLLIHIAFYANFINLFHQN